MINNVKDYQSIKNVKKTFFHVFDVLLMYPSVYTYHNNRQNCQYKELDYDSTGND